MLDAIPFEKTIRRVAACVAVLLIGVVLLCPENARAQGGVLRLHILANSDSAEDQRVKLAVRDAVLTMLPACDSATEAEEYLRAHGRELLALAEQTLRAQGFDYGAQLLLGKCSFPDRTYGKTVYPAGEYEALRIVLGRGEGQNWWCVLFPPLCIVTAEEEPLPSPDELEFESSVLGWLRGLKEEA